MNFKPLKDFLDYHVNVEKIPGVDCIVYKDHEIVFRYFTGVSDIENNKKIRGNELYLIFSMTKMLTVTCALQLLEKGKFNLDDSISKYMPEFENMIITDQVYDIRTCGRVAFGAAMTENAQGTLEPVMAKNPITVFDLLTMQGGFDYATNDQVILDALAQGKKTTKEFVSAMSGKVLSFEPGTHYRYSLCHDVLGALIEIWSGMKLGDYMEQNIFKPLGMKDTFFGVPKDKERLDRMCVRYTFDSERKSIIKLPLEIPYNFTDEYQSGGAGLTSCPEDYAIFLDALACGGIGKTGARILDESSIQEMKKNHLCEQSMFDFDLSMPGYSYGYGVRVHMDPEKSGALSPVGEFGWDGACGAISVVDSDRKISLAHFQHIHFWEPKTRTDLINALYKSLD